MKYRRRPAEVEAVQWNGQPVSELPDRLEGPIVTDNGLLLCGCGYALRPTQWAVWNDDGITGMTDAEFRAAYEPME